MVFKKGDAPILIVLGQSNAHGHGTILPQQDQIHKPLENVLGLAAEYNRSYEITDVTWSKFVTYGMNLGENQDNTCCISNIFSNMWQKEINQGKKLPDLHIIQISIGGQGVNEFEKNDSNMWYVNREPYIGKNENGDADVSLYPLTKHILKLAMANLRYNGKNPIILGLHWNQWETELDTGEKALNYMEENYENILEGIYETLSCRCKTYLYRPISKVYNNEEGRKWISQLFDEFTNTYSNVEVIDIRNSPMWDPYKIDEGIFQDDLVHYTNEAQKWFATYQYEEVFGKEIVVIGDSITADGGYISHLNFYFKLYNAEENIRFINLGLSGENVTGLSEPRHPFPRPCINNRIDSLLEKIHPEKIIICYGMNDGIYYPFREDYFNEYKLMMTYLVDKIKSKGIEVIILTPPPFDIFSFDKEKVLEEATAPEFSFNNPYKGYDEVMEIYSNWIKEEFEQKVKAVIDIHSELLEDIKTMRENDSEYKSGDGIHPNRHGHYVIAKTILEKMFDISVVDLENNTRGSGEAVYQLFKGRDELIRNYYRELIGHDHPEKSKLISKEEMDISVLKIEDNIDEILRNNKHLTSKIEQWNGHRLDKFYLMGHEVTIVTPNNRRKGNPWIYRTEFFGLFPYADIALLEEGYFIAYIKLSNLYGTPRGIVKMEQFRKMIVKKFDLCEKPILFGFSRGGLYALHYAAKYPENVSKIYFDAPVVDVYSWPAKYNNGKSKEWECCKRLWKLGDDKNEFMDKVKNAIDALIKYRIPVIIVEGDVDELVPYNENGIYIEKAYENTGIPFKLIVKEGVGHHPHSLEDPREIVEFIME